MKEPKVILTSVDQPEKPGVAYGIKETLEMLDLLAAFNKAYQAAKADGVINGADIVHLVGVVPTLLPAFNGLSLIPNELLDVDLAEADEIVKEVQNKFGLSEPDAKLLIEHSIKAGYHIKEAVKVFPKVF